MMKTHEAGNNNQVFSWASIIEQDTIEQAKRTARSDAVSGPIALMPDAHIGMGATIGSVIPTKNAIIPAATGVDLGCGLIGVKTTLTSASLPDELDSWLEKIEKAIPAGLGKWHGKTSTRAANWLNAHPLSDHASEVLKTKDHERVGYQLGTLGGGNHFVEIGLDEADGVWLILHSGSRGIGNILAQSHIKKAKQLAIDLERRIEDKDLAFFLESDPEFSSYIHDMLWAQDYALENREVMMDALIGVVCDALGITPRQLEIDRIQCHHNYAVKERHGDEMMWITRKGAINAEAGTKGIIPGSMGTSTFIVEGLGNLHSYNSAAHGAGRLMSRTKAKATTSAEDLATQMANVKTWQTEKAESLVDEAPSAYKDINAVMADMEDLVRPLHEVTTILNYKGTS